MAVNAIDNALSKPMVMRGTVREVKEVMPSFGVYKSRPARKGILWYVSEAALEGGDRVNEALELEVGTVIAGKYRLVRLLGEGGMGSVYEAENTWTQRRVAMKFLKPEYANKSDMVHRFMNEAKASTKVEHPNIVEVLDMGQVPNNTALYIVQEFLQGEDLRARLKKASRFELAEAVAILDPILQALQAAHDKQIVHRDLKPENIFLCTGKSGEIVPKVIDFGVSKMMNPTSDPNAFRTRVGTTVGTPYYMSPEQARSTGEIDHRSDIWSMGIVLYELLTGKVPIQAQSVPLLIVKILSEDAPRIETALPGVAPAVAAVVHKALERDPNRRFQSIEEMRLALVSAAKSAQTDVPKNIAAVSGTFEIGHSPASADRSSRVPASVAEGATVRASDAISSMTPASFSTSGATVRASSTPSLVPATVSRTNTAETVLATATKDEPRKSNRMVLGGIALAVVLALGGGVFFAMSSSKTSAPSQSPPAPAPAPQTPAPAVVAAPVPTPPVAAPVAVQAAVQPTPVAPAVTPPTAVQPPPATVAPSSTSTPTHRNSTSHPSSNRNPRPDKPGYVM